MAEAGISNREFCASYTLGGYGDIELMSRSFIVRRTAHLHEDVITVNPIDFPNK